MTVKKLLFYMLLALVPAAVIIPALNLQDSGDTYRDYSDYAFLLRAESAIRNNFPLREELMRLGDALGTNGGRYEITAPGYGYSGGQTGVFVGNGSLMKNIDPPISQYVDENVAGVVEFAENIRQFRKQTYLMLLPTSGAIMQQNLPPYADSVMENQRRFIEEVYGRVSGGLITIDAYSPLIQRQSQYLYYRTENNLTSLGGYYVYSAMLSRMGLGKADYSQFDIDYANTAYYGDLFNRNIYADIRPDLISVFRYSEFNRTPHEFLVTHSSLDGVKTYHTLFPAHAAVIGRELDVFLGGLSAVTDIRSSLQFSGNVLVFGDRTAIAYAPFLANNCSRLTIVDLFYGKSALEGVNIEDYDKIVFAYSVESFMHTNNPSRGMDLLE